MNLTTVLFLFILHNCANGSDDKEKKNVVILLADDLGIGDIGCFGNGTIKTPSIDRLCRDGVKLTHHLSAASVCSPSRAALMTARYPQRFGLAGDNKGSLVVMHIASSASLPRSEATIGDVFSAAGYDTHFTGKWHLGSHCESLGRNCQGPLAHGFDSSFYLPHTLVVECHGNYTFWGKPLDPDFSQVMTISLVLVAVTFFYGCFIKKRVLLSLVLLFISFLVLSTYWVVSVHFKFWSTQGWYQVSPWMIQNFDCIAMNRTEVVEQPIELEPLNDRLTKNSLNFIRSSSRPFLLFHSFAHVHTPIISSERNRGKSRHGRYGDSIEEMDEAVGLILQELKSLGLTEETVVYFTSDHGGHLESLGEDGQRTGGYNGLFKGGKGMGGMEGGIRVPGILVAPSITQKGSVLDTPTSLLDILPTLMDICGVQMQEKLLPHFPNMENLDGISFASHLTRKSNTKSVDISDSDRFLLHHTGMTVNAVRHVTGGLVYKMHVKRPLFSPGSYQCGWGENTFCLAWRGAEELEDLTHTPLLFELTQDPYEDHPIAPNSTQYMNEVRLMKAFLSDHLKKNPYPESVFTQYSNNALKPWLQPLHKNFSLLNIL